MSKAFTKESDSDDEDDGTAALSVPLPPGGKNYVTPQGYARLRAELLQLMDEERPKVVEAVHWAAKNGDRSENGDYIYGKKRLREIDGRIRFLTKRLEIAVPTDPAVHHGSDQVFFGATVRYADESGDERTVTILGIDEADSAGTNIQFTAQMRDPRGTLAPSHTYDPGAKRTLIDELRDPQGLRDGGMGGQQLVDVLT